MTVLVCQLSHFSRIITNWHETLNELSFQMTIWIHMHMSLFFIWLSIVLWIFSQVFLWVILFSDFMCSSKSYHLIWNHMWAFVLYLCDILVMLEHRAFCFVANWSTCLFDQQSYSHQSVAIILSWNCVYWFQFVIQIQFMNFICMSYRTESHLLIYSLCYS